MKCYQTYAVHVTKIPFHHLSLKSVYIMPKLNDLLPMNYSSFQLFGLVCACCLVRAVKSDDEETARARRAAPPPSWSQVQQPYNQSYPQQPYINKEGPL